MGAANSFQWGYFAGLIAAVAIRFKMVNFDKINNSVHTRYRAGVGDLVAAFFIFGITISTVAQSQRRETEQREAAEVVAARAVMSPEERAKVEAQEKAQFEAAARAEGEKQKATDARNEDYNARAFCREKVITSLHDPDSAQIEKASKLYSKKQKDGYYHLQVVGRAKNAFNALRQATFDCYVKPMGLDLWKIKTIKQQGL